MPLDFEEEERRIDGELRWAIQQENTVNHEARRALRGIDDSRRSLTAEMDGLQRQREQLQGIIEGKVKPSAVDLPEEEAQDLKTKLRLRLKGVRGIAIDRARSDLLPVEERIETLEGRIRGLDSKFEVRQRATTQALEELAGLQQSIRHQRGVVRELRSRSDDLAGMVALFGWYNPYELSWKSYCELRISALTLRSKCLSVLKRGEEITGIEKEIARLKGDLKVTLGDAYDSAFIPVVFKDGKSPRGRRYHQDELTLEDVEGMDLAGKVKHHKATSRKAERLSSALLGHIVLIEETLRRIARLCELRLYTMRMRERAKGCEQIARMALETKCELHRRIVRGSELCSELESLTQVYLRDGEALGSRKERVVGILDRFRSDL